MDYDIHKTRILAYCRMGRCSSFFSYFLVTSMLIRQQSHVKAFRLSIELHVYALYSHVRCLSADKIDGPKHIAEKKLWDYMQ